MRGEDFENNDFFGPNSGIKSGSEHVPRLLDSQIRNKTDTPAPGNPTYGGYYEMPQKACDR